jgi:hypothetical protein
MDNTGLLHLNGNKCCRTVGYLAFFQSAGEFRDRRQSLSLHPAYFRIPANTLGHFLNVPSIRKITVVPSSVTGPLPAFANFDADFAGNQDELQEKRELCVRRN